MARRSAPDPGTARERPLRADAERSRQRILDAARELVAADGLRVTHHEVARRAGVGVGTVYRHFPDRAVLLDLVLADEVAVLVRMVEQGLATEDAWDGLVGVLERAAELHATNRGLRDVALGAGRDLAHLDQVRTRVAPLVDRLLRRAQEQGEVRPDVAVTDLLVVHLMLSELAHHSADLHPEVYRRYLQLYLSALRPPSGDRPADDLVAPLTDEQADVLAVRWIVGVPDDTRPG